MADANFPAVIGTHPLGLGAGPDRDGSGLALAITAGFASIEVGTVTARAEAEHNPGAAALALRLNALDRGDCRIGVNIGSQFASLPQHLADDWLDAIAPLTELANFFTLNLSAPYYALLLANENLAALLSAIAAVAAKTRQPLLVKLPFGRPAAEASIVWLLSRLYAAGIGGIVVSSGDAHADAANHLRQAIDISGLPAIATGGVRTISDLSNRISAGACGVQIYSLFAEGKSAEVTELIWAARNMRNRNSSGPVA